VEWVVREGVGQGGEMNQALYAHMNNKRKMKKKTLKKNKKKVSTIYQQFLQASFFHLHICAHSICTRFMLPCPFSHLIPSPTGTNTPQPQDLF
jgi:hypothetical protein